MGNHMSHIDLNLLPPEKRKILEEKYSELNFNQPSPFKDLKIDTVAADISKLQISPEILEKIKQFYVPASAAPSAAISVPAASVTAAPAASAVPASSTPSVAAVEGIYRHNVDPELLNKIRHSYVNAVSAEQNVAYANYLKHFNQAN